MKDYIEQRVKEVYEVIETNKSERNIRGGIATRLKYMSN